jgi:peptidoglycan/xylan/chitin deacetylase (PgdA/CDA1 family)
MTQWFTLTFDDGPSEWTAPILALLEKHDHLAAFFMTGEHIVGRSDLVSLVAESGHTVGPHGLTHERLTELDDHAVEAELKVTAEMIYWCTGDRPTRWRAPYFGVDQRILRIAEGLGLEHMSANLIPEDWMATDPEALAAIVLSELQDGSIVSLHDGIPPRGGSSACTPTRDVTVEAVRLILERAG